MQRLTNKHCQDLTEGRDVTRVQDQPPIDVLLELLDELTEVIATVESFESLPQRLRRDVRVSLEELAHEALRLARGLDGHASIESDAQRHALREGLLQRALEAIAAERYREAEDILFAALDEFPGNAGYYNHLGLIAWERGEISRAEAFYAKAIAAGFPDGDSCESFSWFGGEHGDFLRALEGRALCLYQLGRLDEALPLFESLAAMNVPEYAGCRYLAGEIRHLLGKLDEAITDYRRSPVEPAVLYNLALACFERDELEEAATVFIQAFSSNRAICELVVGRSPRRDDGGLVGYLGSAAYAEEFLDACSPLWRDKPEALAFMERCFDHPLVQHHLSSRRDVAMELARATSAPAPGAPRASSTHSPYRGLALRVLEQLVA